MQPVENYTTSLCDNFLSIVSVILFKLRFYLLNEKMT